MNNQFTILSRNNLFNRERQLTKSNVSEKNRKRVSSVLYGKRCEIHLYVKRSVGGLKKRWGPVTYTLFLLIYTLLFPYILITSSFFSLSYSPWHLFYCAHERVVSSSEQQVGGQRKPIGIIVAIYRIACMIKLKLHDTTR